MTATDYAQVLAANKAANEVHAISCVVVADVTASSCCGCCINCAAIYAGSAYPSIPVADLRNYEDGVSAGSIFGTAL